MTRDEVKVLFRIIDATYPHTYRNDEVLSDAMSVWAVIFAAVDARLVESALYTYISEKHEFAPTPGHIREIIDKMTNPTQLSEGDAWNMVRRAISNGLYGAQEEFDKLPEDVQKAVGSPQWIFYAANSADTNMSVESSNFYRRYRQVIADKKEREAMPPAVKKLVNELIDNGEEREVQLLEDQRAATAFEYEERRQKALEAFLHPKNQEPKEKIETEEKSYADMLRERFASVMENDTNGRLYDQNA